MKREKLNSIEGLKEIFSYAPCGIGFFAANSREPLYLNDAYYRMVGYTPEEYKTQINTDDWKLFFPDDHETSRKISQIFSEKKSTSVFEYRVKRKDNSRIWVRLTITPIDIDDQTCALCFCEDISAEKESYSHLIQVAESIGSSISVMRIKNGKEQLLYGNSTFFDLIGMPSDVYSQNMSKFDEVFISDSDRIKTRDCITKALETGKPQELNYQFLKPNSEPIWMNRRLSIIRQDEENCFLLVSIATDITEKKTLEMSRLMEQRRYKLVMDEMKAAAFEYDFTTGTFYSSENYRRYEISTVNINSILNNTGRADIVHPDDTEAKLKFFAETASGAEKAEGGMRMKLTTGEYCWCRLVGLFYKDENGKPLRTMGMIIDINEEKEKSFMLDNLLNELPGGVAVFKSDSELTCEYFNDGFANIANRSRSDIESLMAEGDLRKALISPVDYQRFIDVSHTAAATGGRINIIFRCIDVNREMRWIHMNATKLREEDGHPVYYCVFTVPSEETALFRSLIEDSATGTLVAERESLRVLYCNRRMMDFYQLPYDTAMTGRLLSDIMPLSQRLLSEEELRTLPADHYIELHRLHQNLFLDIRAKAITWNGTDAFTVYASDETSEYQKHVQQQELLNRVPVGIGIYDIDGKTIRLVYLNDSYYKMIGADRKLREEKIKDHFLDAVHPDDLDEIDVLVQSLQYGNESYSIHFRLLCFDNTYRWFQLTASVAKREGRKITAYCSYTNIDKAVKTQEALQRTNSIMQRRYKQELQQRRVLEKDSSLVIRFDVTTNKLIQNKANQEEFGLFPIGTDGQQILPDLMNRIPTEEERKIAEDFFSRDKALQRYQNGEKEFSAVYRARQRDGRLYWIKAVCRLEPDPETDHLISYTFERNIDIEKKKELVAESVISDETDFIMLVDTVLGEAMLLRFRGSIHSSEDWSLYTEFPLSRIRNTEQQRALSEEDRRSIENFLTLETLISELKTKTVASISYQLKDRVGLIHRMITRAFYLDNTHEDIVVARRDVTDIYAEEQEQKKVLQNALTQAESANRAKSDFLARMSHDLRTPMNVIIGLTSLARDNLNNPEESEHYLSNITQSSKYLMTLINDCLDLEKINSGKMELYPQPYVYTDFYNSMISIVEPLCQQKSITLSITKPTGTEPTITADKTRIEQIYYNLLTNAVKFTPAGGHIDLTTACLSVKDGYVTNECIIRDNGIGMSQEFQKHMYETFSQEANTISPDYEGSGLGLAIVKRLCDLMGAKLSVESELGKGTEFKIIFTLPLADVPKTIEDRQAASIPADILKGKRILLAEDHPVNSMITVKLLEKAGIKTVTAENGRIAVDKFNAVTDHYFDAILMDIRMPIMNGLEAAAEIRKTGRKDAKTIPIIAMTANAFDTDVRASMQAGMNAHLSKPIEPEKLYETLAKLIK